MPFPTNRDSLPFEPKSKQKKQNKKNFSNPVEKRTTPSQSTVNKQKESSSLREIPEVVSKRMVRRMALFSYPLLLLIPLVTLVTPCNN